MSVVEANTARLLGSVALRYRRAIPPPHWPMTAVTMPGRWPMGLEPSGLSVVSPGSTARDEPLAALEAVLLLCRGPEGSRRLAQLAGLADGTRARTLVRSLNRLYDAQQCAFRVEEVAGGFQLRTRPKFGGWLRRLHAAEVEVRLSAPAMETLAVVAYRQPVLRAQIEAIRGVQCGEILRQLMERDLVRIAGRSEELGRPYLYGTTRRFLEIFGLHHLDELPRADALRGSAGSDPGEPTESTDQSQQTEEETQVSTLNALEAAPPAALAAEIDSPGNEPEEEEYPFDGFGDEEDDDENDEDYDEDDDEEYEYDDEDEEWDDEDDYDEDEDDEEDEYDEDDDLEDEPWEEVEDDDEDEDEEDDDEEDEEWDDDEEWEYEDEDEED